MRIFLSSLATALVLAASTAHSEPVSPASGAATAKTPEDARAALNRQQAEAAQRQKAETQKAYDGAMQARAAEIRRRQEAYEAEKARIAREYEETMARWKADVAACKAGDRSKCAAQ